MPLYDFQCLSCEKEFEEMSKIDERKEVKCPKCHGATKIIYKVPFKDDWFKPYWDPHFDIKPIFVRSKKHMKELCLKYNVTSRALGDVRNIKEI